MSKNTENTDAKANCDMTRAHIASLIKTLQAELADREMTEDTWPVAGSLGHVRELLAETVGFLKGVEGSEIINAKAQRPAVAGTLPPLVGLSDGGEA